jgi:hypothetical protein
MQAKGDSEMGRRGDAETVSSRPARHSLLALCFLAVQTVRTVLAITTHEKAQRGEAATDENGRKERSSALIDADGEMNADRINRFHSSVSL